MAFATAGHESRRTVSRPLASKTKRCTGVCQRAALELARCTDLLRGTLVLGAHVSLLADQRARHVHLLHLQLDGRWIGRGHALRDFLRSTGEASAELAQGLARPWPHLSDAKRLLLAPPGQEHEQRVRVAIHHLRAPLRVALHHVDGALERASALPCGRPRVRLGAPSRGPLVAHARTVSTIASAMSTHGMRPEKLAAV